MPDEKEAQRSVRKFEEDDRLAKCLRRLGETLQKPIKLSPELAKLSEFWRAGNLSQSLPLQLRGEKDRATGRPMGNIGKPADAYFGLYPNVYPTADEYEELNRKYAKLAEKARKDFPTRRARAQLEYEQELERLRKAKAPAGKGVPPTAANAPSPSPAHRATAAKVSTRTGARLKKLKNESKLTWDTIARESGVSRRRLFDISAGATPSIETKKVIRDYFSGILKRRCQF